MTTITGSSWPDSRRLPQPRSLEPGAALPGRASLPGRAAGRPGAGQRGPRFTFPRSGSVVLFALIWLAAATAPVGAATPLSGPGISGWLAGERWNVLVAGVLLVGAMAAFIRAAGRGRSYPIRHLPGAAAIDAAVRQAATAARPILFVAGSEDLNDIQTIAGLSILEQVAARAQTAHVDLRVPHFHSLVMTAADDILQRAQVAAGAERTDTRDSNYYVSDEQFGFVAGVTGTMCREKPSACLYFGSFYAEALALAEVGRTVGAVQIAGTGQAAQIPFLLATCDHVLIGEELFAVTASLSHDPRLLGSLRGQDFGKLLAIVTIVLGSLLTTITQLTGSGSVVALRDGLLAFLRGN